MRRRVEEETIGLKLTPMIDMVFLLLAFSMYNVRFRTTEGQLGVFLPRGRAKPEVVEKLKREMDSVTLSLRWEEGRPRVLLEGVEFSQTDHEELFGYLDRPGAVTEKLLKLKELIPEATVVIDADYQVPMDYLVGAINSCVRAGLTKISFIQPELAPPVTAPLPSSSS